MGRPLLVPAWFRDVLEKAAQQLSLFDEQAHPRHGKGSPEGGRFAPKGGEKQGGGSDLRATAKRMGDASRKMEAKRRQPPDAKASALMQRVGDVLSAAGMSPRVKQGDNGYTVHAPGQLVGAAEDRVSVLWHPGGQLSVESGGSVSGRYGLAGERAAGEGEVMRALRAAGMDVRVGIWGLEVAPGDEQLAGGEAAQEASASPVLAGKPEGAAKPGDVVSQEATKREGGAAMPERTTGRLAARDPEKPWEWPASVYQETVLKVHEPWIGEISPMQYAYLSKRGQKQYDEKRAREWDASDAAKGKWRAAVIAAYEDGTIDPATTEMNDEARDAIFFHERRKEEAALEEKRRAATKANVVQSLDELSPGDRIYHVAIGLVEVVKVNKKSVRVRLPNVIRGQEFFTQPIKEGRPLPFWWKSPRDSDKEFEEEQGISKSHRTVVVLRGGGARG